MFFCFKISWKASPIHFVLRTVGKAIIPLNSLLISYFTKLILDDLQRFFINNQIEIIRTVTSVVGISLLRIINNVSRGIIDYATQIHSLKMNEFVSKKAIEIGCEIDYSIFYDSKKFNSFATAINDAGALTRIFWNAVDCISPMVIFFIVFITIGKYNILYSLFMFLVSVPAAIAHYKYTSKLYKLDKDSIFHERQKDYYSRIASNKDFAHDVRLFNMKHFLLKKYEEVQKEELIRKEKVIKKETVRVNVIEIIPEVVMLMICMDLVYGIMKHRLSIGDYSLFSGLLFQMWSNIVLFIVSTSKVIESQMRILNYKGFVSMTNKSESKCSEKYITHIKSIEFKNVTFAYPNSNKNVLDNISFRIEKGERIALVGINGSGKSTIIKLLLGFYKPQTGQVLINGCPVSEYAKKDYYRHISVCYQLLTVYCLDLEENITLNGNQHDSNRIIASLRDADAESILGKVNNNVEIPITKLFDNKGIELSGGEAQKLVIARTLFKNSECMVLDEPSSALDPEAEKKLYNLFRNLSKEKTIIFTTHRMTNIDLAQKILVLENGKIIESGDKNSLLSLDGKFASLYKCYKGIQ